MLHICSCHALDPLRAWVSPRGPQWKSWLCCPWVLSVLAEVAMCCQVGSADALCRGEKHNDCVLHTEPWQGGVWLLLGSKFG